MNIEEVILKHAIINAKKYGKAKEGAVIAKVVAEIPEVKKNIKEIRKKISEIISQVNSMSEKEIDKKIEEMGIVLESKKEVNEYHLPDLPGAEKGKVVMRMAPFPSGPLHIGNARMIILNDEYVKKYNGKLILFYDDTIGSKDKPVEAESYDLIKEGLDWLGVNYHEVYYKSDRMELYYKYGEEMLEKGWAYVCTCSADEIRRNRKLGIACSCRNRSIKENLELWRDMLSGKIKEGKAVVRIKTDMKHPDPAFRDRIIFRISEREHPRVGKKYRVWPMLEFSWAIDDYMLGITHILRGKELVIEDKMEEFIWNKFGWRKAKFIHYGMIRIKGAKLSKSVNRRLIKEGVLKGWDDPRTWSLQALRKRGIKPEAIRRFILKMGMSEADVAIPAEILYAENRKIIDPIANRYFAVLDPIKISFKANKKEIEIGRHPDFPERGKRTIHFNTEEIYVDKKDFEKYKGEKVALIGLGTIILEEKAEFVSDEVSYDIPKIHWVSIPNKKITIVMPDGKEKTGIADPGIDELKEDDIVQFYRVGFCRLDDKERFIFYFAHK